MLGLTLVDVSEFDANRILAACEITDDDGTVRRHAQILPKSTIEWRAAEYDLHPVNDFDELVDMILFEPHVDVPDDQRLYHAESPEIAKRTMRAAVKAAKNKSDQQKSAKSDEKLLRQKLGKLSYASPATFADKQAMVNLSHEAVRVNRGPLDPIQAAVLRREFNQAAARRNNGID